MDQISKRNDEELKRWTEEVTSPRLLSLAMTELSLRAIRRLESSLADLNAASDQYSQRIAFLSKVLIWAIVALILVALPSSISEMRKLVSGESGSVRVIAAQPVRAESPGGAAEADCPSQAGKATQEFAHRQTENQLNFRIVSSENHYNKQLHKCFVEIRTFGGEGESLGFGNFVLDAYENSTQVHCLTPVRPQPNVRLGQCYDRQKNSISREEADNQILQLMDR
jgi:hypothetical protein